MMRKLKITSYLLPVMLFGFIFIGQIAHAQEVYFSISGKNVAFDSGDRIGQHDYWFRPAPGVENPRPATIEIFDAGLGGFADVISGTPNTRTEYALHRFSNLYELGENSVQELSNIDQSNSLASIFAFTENRFLNRWVPFFQLEDAMVESDTGFIMRVSTDDGNDANDFRIRITGEGSQDWQLITMNLSIGLIDSKPDNRFQFRPLWTSSDVPDFELIGEEDTEVFIMDAFGETRPVRQGWDQLAPQKYGKDNYWAIVMTGSSIRINNRVLKGVSEIVPFYFDPVILNDSEMEIPVVNQIPGTTCNSVTMETEAHSFYLNTQEAEWQTTGQNFSGNRFTHEFRDYGSFQFDLLIPTRGIHVPGFVVQSGEILVNAPPVAILNDFTRVISPGQPITLDASASYDPEGRDLQFQWMVNGAFRSNAEQFVFSSTISGQYEIDLILDDHQPNVNCTQTTEKLTIRVNTQPYAEINFDEVVAKDVRHNLTAVNDSDADNDQLSFRWTLDGQEEIQTGREASFRHQQAGNYTVQLTVDDQTGTQNATYGTSTTYKVNAAPVPQFSLVDIVAPGQSVVLDASSSIDPDGDPLTFRWDLSDERVFRGSEHIIDFVEPGLYSIKLVANDGENVANSEQTLTREIRVNEAPVPVISALEHTNTPIVNFSASDSYDDDQEIVSYQWDFGDGSVGNGKNVTHTYESNGVYTARLTVDDGTDVPNSIQFTDHTVVINRNPVAEIIAPEIVSADQEFILNGISSNDIDGEISSYSWLVNGIEIGEGPELAHHFTRPGLYSINLKVRDDTPFDDAFGISSHIIRVNHSPVAKWSTLPEVTEPNRLTIFDASASYDNDNESLTYRWEFNDGVTLNGERVERVFEQSGTYYFTLYVDDGEGLSNSVSTTDGSIRVNLSPIIVTETLIRTNNRDVLLDASESYDPDGDHLQYTWILPDGSYRHDSAFTWTAPERGVFEISLQLDDREGLDNSVSSERIVILNNRPPVAVVDARVESCSGQLIIFSSARSYDPDGDSFTTHWDFGDGNTSYEANPVHSFDEPGIYNVIITLDDGYSETPTIQEIPVIIEGSPVARIRETTMTVCANSPVVFDGSLSTDPNGMVGSFSWDFGDGNSAVGEQTTHLFARPGTYRVALTITGSGTGRCPNVSQAIVNVDVIEAPSAIFDIVSIISPGTKLTLDASDSEAVDNIIQKNWTVFKDDETIATLEGNIQEFTPDIPGNYRIMLTITTDNEVGCSQNSITRAVHVNRAPEIVWNLPDHWPQNSFFQLNADGTSDHDGFIDSYHWYFNGEEIGTGLTMPLPVDQYGEFETELVVRDNANVSNSEVILQGKVLINPPPNPNFSLPDIIYKGETLHLTPDTNQDAMGHPVHSTWIVNGLVISETSFIVNEPIYTITLVQNDSLGLANSEASIRKVLSVQQPLVPQPVLPDAIVTTQELTRLDMNLPDTIVILDNGTSSDTWKPNSTSENVLTLGWQPRDEVLEQFEITIPVYDPLSTDISEIRKQTVFNPVNRKVEIVAPTINRDEETTVMYRWIDPITNTELDQGKIAFLETVKGENRFELIISDEQRIYGATELRIPVVIIAE